MRRTGAKVDHHGAVLRPEDRRLRRDATGAKVLILPPSVGGIEGVNDYIDAHRSTTSEQLAAP